MDAEIHALQEQIDELRTQVELLTHAHNIDSAYHREFRKAYGTYYRAWWYRVIVFFWPVSLPPYHYGPMKHMPSADRAPVPVPDKVTTLPVTRTRAIR